MLTHNQKKMQMIWWSQERVIWSFIHSISSVKWCSLHNQREQEKLLREGSATLVTLQKACWLVAKASLTIFTCLSQSSFLLFLKLNYPPQKPKLMFDFPPTMPFTSTMPQPGTPSQPLFGLQRPCLRDFASFFKTVLSSWISRTFPSANSVICAQYYIIY